MHFIILLLIAIGIFFTLFNFFPNGMMVLCSIAGVLFTVLVIYIFWPKPIVPQQLISEQELIRLYGDNNQPNVFDQFDPVSAVSAIKAKPHVISKRIVVETVPVVELTPQELESQRIKSEFKKIHDEISHLIVIGMTKSQVIEMVGQPVSKEVIMRVINWTTMEKEVGGENWKYGNVNGAIMFSNDGTVSYHE